MSRLKTATTTLGLTAGAVVAGTALMARAVEHRVPRQGRTLHLAGEQVHYVDRGEGRPVVLIHGLGGQLAHFTHSLMDALPGHRLVALDRSGSGYSSRNRTDAASLPAQAAQVALAIEALALDRPLVVGHSLGGAVALQLAVDRPDLVGGLALVAPLTQPMEDAPEVFRALTIESAPLRQVVAWTLATPLSLATRKKALAVVFSPEPVPDDFGTAGGGELGLRPSVFLSASGDLRAARDDLPQLVQRYGEITVPVGILYGRGDALLDATTHGEGGAAALPTAELTLVDGGHMLPLTQPKTTADFIRAVEARIDAG